MQSLGHLCQAVREVGDEVLNGCNSERVSGPGSTSVTNLIFGNISRSRAMAPCSRLLMYYSLAADPCGPAKHCPVFHCPPSGLATPAHDRDDHVDGHPDHDHNIIIDKDKDKDKIKDKDKDKDILKIPPKSNPRDL